MSQATAQNVIRRVLVASISGALPDEFRDEAVELLTEALNAPDDDIRALAVIALNEIGHGPAIVPAMIDALHDSNEMVRKRAARVIGELGTLAASALPHLDVCLRDESRAVRLECAAALGRLGPAAESSLPSLFGLLLDHDLRVRTVVSCAIRKFGQPALAYAMRMAQDSEARMRERACELLGQIGCPSDPVVEVLLEACTDSEPEVRAAARQALDRLQQRA